MILIFLAMFSITVYSNPHRDSTAIQAPTQRVGTREIDWWGLTNFHVSHIESDNFVFYNDIGPNPSQRWFREGWSAVTAEVINHSKFR